MLEEMIVVGVDGGGHGRSWGLEEVFMEYWTVLSGTEGVLSRTRTCLHHRQVDSLGVAGATITAFKWPALAVSPWSI